VTAGADQDEQQRGLGQVAGAEQRPKRVHAGGDEAGREQVGGVPQDGDGEAGAEAPGAVSPKPSAAYRVISDHYFAVMGIPMARGRAFTTQDHDQFRVAAKGVAIVNELMAKALRPSEDPVGQHLRIAGVSDRRDREIVGVVRYIRDRNLANKPPRSEVFVPVGQALAPSMALVVLTAGDPRGAHRRRTATPTLPRWPSSSARTAARRPARVSTGRAVSMVIIVICISRFHTYANVHIQLVEV